MSKYHEKPDVSPKFIHQSVDGNNRYTIDFGERRRVKNTLNESEIRNKKKHKLRQKRKAVENAKKYYGDRYDSDLEKFVNQSVGEMLNRNYKETTDETN